jgi:hypothetical protein
MQILADDEEPIVQENLPVRCRRTPPVREADVGCVDCSVSYLALNQAPWR